MLQNVYHRRVPLARLLTLNFSQWTKSGKPMNLWTKMKEGSSLIDLMISLIELIVYSNLFSYA